MNSFPMALTDNKPEQRSGHRVSATSELRHHTALTPRLAPAGKSDTCRATHLGRRAVRRAAVVCVGTAEQQRRGATSLWLQPRRRGASGGRARCADACHVAARTRDRVALPICLHTSTREAGGVRGSSSE